MSTLNLKILFNYLVLCFISKVLSFSNSVLDYTHFQGEQIEILAGPITSSNNPIPFNFYHLDICKPKKIEKEEDSLGEILTGKEMYKTSYEAFINKNLKAVQSDKLVNLMSVLGQASDKINN